MKGRAGQLVVGRDFSPQMAVWGPRAERHGAVLLFGVWCDVVAGDSRSFRLEVLELLWGWADLVKIRDAQVDLVKAGMMLGEVGRAFRVVLIQTAWC